MNTLKKHIILLLLSIGAAHAQTATDRLNTASGTPTPNPNPNPVESPNTPGAGIADPLDMSGGMLFNKVLQFGYFPSERDPFISHKVLSPFVTEEDLPPPPDLDQEKINSAKKAIDNLVKSKVEIYGISTGRVGAGYAIGNLGQILKPGEVLLIPMEEDEQGEVDAAVQAAVTAGAVGLGIAVYRNNLLLETKKIEEKSVIFRSPVRIPGEEDSEFTVDYTKTIGFEPKPTSSDIKNPESELKKPQ